MRQTVAEVLYNREISHRYYKMGIATEEIASLIKPGEFLMLRAWHGDGTDPLLNRPFGVYRVIDNGIGVEILYKVVGRGTRIMSSLRQGDEVSLLGPLGKGFPVSGDWKDVVMVSGGVGIAPFLHLVEWFKDMDGYHPSMVLYHGGRDRDDMVCIDDFKTLNVDVRLSTETGEVGVKGVITRYLEDELSKGVISPSVIYACGPKGMLKDIAGISMSRDISCYVSIDRVMGCGIGTCLGCVVKGRDDGGNEHYLRVCKEGPVFDVRDIVWEEI